MGYTLDEQIADARKDLADVTTAFESAVSEHRASWERLCHWKDALNEREVKLNRLLSERTARLYYVVGADVAPRECVSAAGEVA